MLGLLKTPLWLAAPAVSAQMAATG